MKNIILAVCLVLATSLASAQLSTGSQNIGYMPTENIFNFYKFLSKAGAGVDTNKSCSYLVGFVIGTSIASDSLVFINGAAKTNQDTVYTCNGGATALLSGVFVPLNVQISSDTLCVYRKKNTAITYIYRK